MKWYEILLFISMFIIAVIIVYHIYKMTELDARSRGFKHPKLWGLFASGGQNGEGILLYLIGRREIPICNDRSAKVRYGEIQKKYRHQSSLFNHCLHCICLYDYLYRVIVTDVI